MPCWDQLCKAEDGIPISVGREDKQHPWPTENPGTDQKIPEQYPLINSQCPEGAWMLYPDLTNLQTMEFPWSQVFSHSNQEIQALFPRCSLGWSLSLIWSLSPWCCWTFIPRAFLGFSHPWIRNTSGFKASPLPVLCFLLSFPPELQRRILDPSTNLPCFRAFLTDPVIHQPQLMELQLPIKICPVNCSSLKVWVGVGESSPSFLIEWMSSFQGAEFGNSRCLVIFAAVEIPHGIPLWNSR